MIPVLDPMMEPPTEKLRGAQAAPSPSMPPFGPAPRSHKARFLWRIPVLAFVLWILGQYGRTLFYDDVFGYGPWDKTSKPTGSWLGWDDITPSEKLEWHPCIAEPFQCARLTVPMDYHRPLNESADHPKVHLALVMLPGQNRTRDPVTFSESPLLINPGGPGGSGTGFVLGAGRMLQTILGNHHDIIGFDPRGIGATTPPTNCFAAVDDPQGLNGANVGLINRLSWLVAGHDVGLINSSDVALSKVDVRARALARLCKKVDDFEGENSVFRYANTANVARDMLSIVEAWDEWRSAPKCGHGRSQEEPPVDVPPAQHEAPDGEPVRSLSTKGKLVYWGFSYGTLLGATFAAMFPDKVGRVILDGVVDADHYVEPTWVDSLVDADAIWEGFFTSCHEVGQKCKFFRDGDEVGDIRDRYHALMGRLQKQPAIVIPAQPDANFPVLITASDVKMAVFGSLYAPNAGFAGLALLLDLLLEDNLSLFVGPMIPPVVCHEMDTTYLPNDALAAVMCSDKRYKLDDDVPSLQKLFEKMASYSSFADIWMGINLDCNGWAVEVKDPPMRWDDRLGHDKPAIETDFPLLFLSGRRDPVTPLRAALKMARKFAGAGLVEQASDGHCTLACGSPCTARHVRAYLDDGVVPPAPKFGNDDEEEDDTREDQKGEWATCGCAEKPWGHVSGAAMDEEPSGLAAEDVAIVASYRELRSHFLAQTTLRLVDELSPLRQFIAGMSSGPLAEQQTCAQRGH